MSATATSTITYVYCMGSIAGSGFLNGNTGSGSVNLQPNANGGGAFSGTVWALAPTSEANTYTIQCQGTKPGNQYLSGDATHGSVALAPSAGGSSTEWVLAKTSSTPQQYTIQLADTSYGALYLNGVTYEGEVNLVNNAGVSGASWLVLNSFQPTTSEA